MFNVVRLYLFENRHIKKFKIVINNYIPDYS